MRWRWPFLLRSAGTWWRGCTAPLAGGGRTGGPRLPASAAAPAWRPAAGSLCPGGRNRRRLRGLPLAGVRWPSSGGLPRAGGWRNARSPPGRPRGQVAARAVLLWLVAAGRRRWPGRSRLGRGLRGCGGSNERCGGARPPNPAAVEGRTGQK